MAFDDVARATTSESRCNVSKHGWGEQRKTQLNLQTDLLVACAVQRAAAAMSRALISLAPASTGTIQEVVLRGTQSLAQHQLRQRALGYLRRQTRCERIYLGPQSPADEVAVSLRDWDNPAANALSFDRLIDNAGRHGRFRLVLWTRDWLLGVQPALEILNRYQRLLPHSREGALPELRNASDDALDVWLWALRLEPTASRDVQRAALRGDEPSLQRAQSSGSLVVLRDAADVSFFSRRSWHHLQAWGLEQTQCTVERRLERMSDAAVCHALATRQPPEISTMMEAFLDVLEPSPAVPHAQSAY